MTSSCRVAMLIVMLALGGLNPTYAKAQEWIRSSPQSLWSQDGESGIEPGDLPDLNPDLEFRLPFLFGITYEGRSPKQMNPDRLFSLASVKKVITAATALRELGPDFRFSNEFTGALDESSQTLFSPAFSMSGDPTWAHEAYEETLTTRISKVIAELKRLNVRHVQGEIRVLSLRASIDQFSRPPEWKRDWLLKCYASLPTLVSMNGNCAFLSIQPRKVEWVTPGVDTPLENLTVPSRYDAVSVVPVLDDQGRVIKYKIQGGLKNSLLVSLPVHLNENWLRNLFKRELSLAGISYEAHANSDSTSTNPIFVDLSSKPLKEILIPFLQESINLVGDRLHIEAPEDFITLASLIPDAREYENVTLKDGSGLIASNKISPRTMFHFMSALMKQPYFEFLYAGLPVSGESGTLRSRMGDSFLRGRVHAKTGTINGVANLAGYLTKSDQSLEPFVIFTESGEPASTARAKIDAEVAGFARKN